MKKPTLTAIPSPTKPPRCSICNASTVCLYKEVRYCAKHHPDRGAHVPVWPDEAEIRDAAKDCKTYAQLWRQFPSASIEWIRHVDAKYGLGLAPNPQGFTSSHTPGRACPKPEKRAKT